MAVCVGMVIGAGIFKISPMVARDTPLYLAWAFGGLLSFVGALCFAELAAAFPDAGGDYHFLRRAFGRPGELFIIGIVTLTALSVMNAILTAGPRTTYAAARDLARELQLGRWNAQRGTPTAAVLATSAVALLLVAFGAATHGGFSTMGDYLSPVYWFFLVLSGAAVIMLRRREPDVPRPFKVPLYPLLPVLFMACSGYLLYSSLVYVKTGALVGVAVLALGALLLWPLTRQVRSPSPHDGKRRGTDD